jgi:metal-sulfur cluster biosynthetic enzyme
MSLLRMILSPMVAIILSATTFFCWANKVIAIAIKQKVNKLFFIRNYFFRNSKNQKMVFKNTPVTGGLLLWKVKS